MSFPNLPHNKFTDNRYQRTVGEIQTKYDDLKRIYSTMNKEKNEKIKWEIVEDG